MKIQTITVRAAAEITGMSAETIQAGLIQGRFPWGYAIQTSKDRWRYWINAKKFSEIEMVDLPNTKEKT
jgi:hypothetical protein